MAGEQTLTSTTGQKQANVSTNYGANGIRGKANKITCDLPHGVICLSSQNCQLPTTAGGV